MATEKEEKEEEEEIEEKNDLQSMSELFEELISSNHAMEEEGGEEGEGEKEGEAKATKSSLTFSTKAASTAAAPARVYRLSWSIDATSSRCKRTTIPSSNAEGASCYVFDGFFLLLASEHYIDIPRFDYVCDSTRRAITLTKAVLPACICIPTDDDHEFTEAMNWFHQYLFAKLLRIEGYADLLGRIEKTESQNIDSEDCMDIVNIVKHVSVASKQPLDDFLAKCADIKDVLGDVVFLPKTNMILRADAIERAESPDYHSQSMVVHYSTGSPANDGVSTKPRIRNREGIPLLYPHSFVHAERIVVEPKEAFMTGFRSDIIEIATAIPILIPFIRHFLHLLEVENIIGIQFINKALLRQAFIHYTYVEQGVQSSNLQAAVTARVRAGYLLSSAKKRKRPIEINSKGNSMGVKKRKLGNSSEFAHTAGSVLIQESQQLLQSKTSLHFDGVDSYERLEFLGDAVLGLIISQWSFLKFPSHSEEMLTKMRSTIVNNDNLARVATALGFHKCVVTGYKTKEISIGDKLAILADCTEALVGALYLDQGIEACRKLVRVIVRTIGENMLSLVAFEDTQLDQVIKTYIHRDDSHIKSMSEMLQRYETFREKTQIEIKNVDLWIQCLTHKSFGQKDIDMGIYSTQDTNYERIEFLGDAVLQLVISSHMVQNYTFQEKILSDVRSALVRNSRLAGVGNGIGLESFVRYGIHAITSANDGINKESIVADVFESLLGAIFLESGWEGACQYVQKYLFPLIERVIANEEWIMPKSRLKLVQKRVFESPKLRFFTLESSGPRHESIHGTQIKHGSFVSSRARAKLRSKSEEIASLKTLRMMGYGNQAPSLAT